MGTQQGPGRRKRIATSNRWLTLAVSRWPLAYFSGFPVRGLCCCSEFASLFAAHRRRGLKKCFYYDLSQFQKALLIGIEASSGGNMCKSDLFLYNLAHMVHLGCR